MGYHVTILRTKAGQPDPITREEVVRALASMGGRLALDPDQPDALQLVDPFKGDQSELLFIDDGELWSKTPSDEFVALMIELADLIGARVRGDEFETYRALDDVYVHPDDEAVVRTGQAVTAERRRTAGRDEWLARFKVMAIAMLVGGSFVACGRMWGWR